MKVSEVLKKVNELGTYMYTCSADHPSGGCITYAMDGLYVEKIQDSGKDVVILVPEGLIFTGMKVIQVEDPAAVFMAVHNYLNRYENPEPHIISALARIHPKAHIGADGMKYVKSGNMLINMKHMGNVIIKQCAEIGPFSTVARATLDSTIIEEQARIGQGVYIGHNCKIGRRTIIVDGAVVGGSAEIGNDCWLGLNCTIRNGAKVCDNVFIAMGALVSKNIDKPGMYVGSPARRRGDWDGSWR